MFKGRLFKAVKNLDREETAFCLAQEPELLHAVDQNGRNLLQIVLSVETVNSDHRTVRQIDLIDYSSAQGLDLHFVDRPRRCVIRSIWSGTPLPGAETRSW